MLYRLPQSWDAKAKFIAEIQKRLKVSLVVGFGDGPLMGCEYRATGMNSFWSLIGAVASLGQPFCFDVDRLNLEYGIMGGFSNGRFCLWSGRRDGLDVFSLQPLDLDGAPRVEFGDWRYGDKTQDGRVLPMPYWVPECAMMSWEDFLRLGVSVLISDGNYIRTPIYMDYAHWADERYAIPRQPPRPPLSRLEDLLAHTEDLEVVMHQYGRSLVDRYRVEEIHFADQAKADEIIDKLLAAGVKCRRLDAWTGCEL